MSEASIEKRQAWITISTFLLVLTGLSAVPHLAIVKLNPVSIYVGALMWTPAIAAFLTLKIRGRKISSLPWKWGKWRYQYGAYLTPVFYITIAYTLAWALGFGDILNTATIEKWARELGLGGASPNITMFVMIALLATVGFIKSGATVLGEEIGWRCFFIWELRKVLPFGGVAIVSGLIWSFWHWPLVVYYGGGDPIFQMANFTLMIVSMSVIMTYFTFKSGSVWPAVIFHTAHNIYIQKIFTPITIKTDQTSFWIDEYGLMIPIIVTLFALYFWRAAKAEGL